MKVSKRKYLLFASLALLGIGSLSVCYGGEKWGVRSVDHRESRKHNKQLTVSVARQWYESHYDSVVCFNTRFGGNDDMPAFIKPKWSHATESNRGRYEVVQMPILTQARHMIVDEETRLHFDELHAKNKLRNSTHLVILKNLETGQVRSFVSIFVGSYKYLKKKRINRNTYLYRDKKFDGRVMFFKLNGSMINGWKYRDGKIVGKITPIDENTKELMARSGSKRDHCYEETYYEMMEKCEEKSQPQKSVLPTKNLDAYVGTWVYQNSDTIFKIRLQKGQKIGRSDIYNGLYGGYYLSVKGKIIENYWGDLPEYWDSSKEPRPDNLYIWASNPSYTLDEIDPNCVGVWFYDQRKKHFGGKGISGGYIHLLSPTKIHWKLNEALGIWYETEGDESITDAERQPIGFSVPDNVIMMKE